MQKVGSGDDGSSLRTESPQQRPGADAQFQLFANCIEDYAFILFDPNNLVTGWNRGAERLTGFTYTDMAGRSGSILFAPEDREKGEDKREHLTARDEGRAEDERWHVRKDGSRFWGSGVMMRLTDENKQIVGYAKVLRDLTARRNAEIALQESEERFRLFIDNVRDYALFQVSPDGRISGWNPGAEHLFGYAEPQIVGQSFSVLFSPEDAERGEPERELARTLAEGRVEDERWLVRHDGSRFYARWITNPMYDGNGRLRGFAKVLRDETDRKRVEELRDYLQQRERDVLTQHVKSTGEALDRTKEELRALAASLMTVQEDERRRIARELHDDLAQRLALLGIEIDEARRASGSDARLVEPALARLQGRLTALSEDVRNMSHRLHPSLLEDLGLEAALRSLAADIQATHGLAVRFNCDATGTAVPANVATALYRIAQEALRNVTKHAGEARVTVSLLGTGRDLRLSVIDDGRGFDPEQVRSKGGIGFVSMQERAQLVGGQLIVRSAPGNGTEIQAVVPKSGWD